MLTKIIRVPPQILLSLLHKRRPHLHQPHPMLLRLLHRHQPPIFRPIKLFPDHIHELRRELALAWLFLFAFIALLLE